MSAIQVDTGISFEEYLSLYDGQHAEWIGGKVVLMRPASDRHQDLARFLTALLSFWAEAKEAGVVRPAPLAMKLKPDERGREPAEFYLLDRRGTYKPAPLEDGIFHSRILREWKLI